MIDAMHCETGSLMRAPFSLILRTGLRDGPQLDRGKTPRSNTAETVPFDLQEQLARIRRAQAESDKFVEEARKLSAEQNKLFAEALKSERERALAPWQIMVASMAAGAALFGAGAAFIELIGP